MAVLQGSAVEDSKKEVILARNCCLGFLSYEWTFGSTPEHYVLSKEYITKTCRKYRGFISPFVFCLFRLDSWRTPNSIVC